MVGILDLAGNTNSGTVTLTNAAIFATTAYVCTVTDTTSASGNPVAISAKATSGFTLTNTGLSNKGDNISYSCVG